MAWERTAFSSMAVGLLMTRVGATVHPALGFIGILHVCASAGLFVWAGRHYEDLHGRLQAGEPPTHPTAVIALGIGATAAAALGTVLVVVAAVAGE